MPNTDRFQHLPDYFSSREEGKGAVRENTNPRYKFFRQVHYTAGDYEQFLEHWDASSHVKEGVVSGSCSKEQLPVQIHSPLFKDIRTEDVFGTFEYIFHKFKKGIFVKFVGNELRVFLPFSKIDYTNEWAEKIRVDPIYKDFEGLFEEAGRLSGYPVDKKKIHFMRDHWYANNGLLRYEFPISENDSGVSTLRDMLMTLAEERDIPDCEFFLNKRDFPVLKQDGTESYECIFGEDHPLVSFKRDTYCPVLGMTTTEKHADIPIPTWEDWARSEFPRKWFGKEFASFPDPFLRFEDKPFSTAVFRGSSTGLGTTPRTNPRLYYALLSKDGRRDEDGHLFLDCGITKWNCRPRRSSSSHPYSTFDPRLIETLGTARFLSMQEQSAYKYIIHLPGHSESYRLSMEMATGSVILMYPCSYKLWFSHLLQPFIHYVPIEKDIYETIRWCKANETTCVEISRQARLFYETNLCREGLLDYLQTLLVKLQSQTGKIKFLQNNLNEFQEEIQTTSLQKDVLWLQQFHIQNNDWKDQDCSLLHPRTFQILLHKIQPGLIEEKIRDAPIIKESRNVLLKKIVLFGRTLCVKSPKVTDNKNILHESFVGQIGTNRFANICPMIVYVFGRVGNHLIMDFIDGETFESALCRKTDQEVLPFFINIFIQILLLLSHLQNEMGFIHFDLYPWNIIIRKNTEKRTFCFSLPDGKSVRFCPKEYPVIIDMGKSHIIHENIHFANVNPFRIHLYHDVLSIFISGLYLVLHQHKIPFHDSKLVLNMFQHLAPSSYTFNKHIENLSTLKQFLRKKKKFSNMLIEEKPEFRDKTPSDFFWFLHQRCLVDKAVFSIGARSNEVMIASEIFFSRYWIEKEICELTREDTAFIWDSFQKERLQNQSFGGSLVMSAYHNFLNLKLLEKVFPERISPNLKETLKRNILKISSLDLSMPETPTNGDGSVVLPRFFSHPDPNILFSGENKPSQPFFHRHLILNVLFSASSEIKELLPFRQKMIRNRKDILFNPFSKFYPLSVKNTLCRFKEWLDKKTNR